MPTEFAAALSLMLTVSAAPAIPARNGFLEARIAWKLDPFGLLLAGFYCTWRR
jgi:hypothetical protein